jgi:hypothetical protein
VGYPPRDIADAMRIMGTWPTTFCNWDDRPAVLVGKKAYAVLG